MICFPSVLVNNHLLGVLQLIFHLFLKEKKIHVCTVTLYTKLFKNSLIKVPNHKSANKYPLSRAQRLSKVIYVLTVHRDLLIIS